MRALARTIVFRMMAGYGLAAVFPVWLSVVWLSVVAVLALELVRLRAIRDNLTLNVVMLVRPPVEAIKTRRFEIAPKP